MRPTGTGAGCFRDSKCCALLSSCSRCFSAYISQQLAQHLTCRRRGTRRTHHGVLLVRPHQLHVRPSRWCCLRRQLRLLQRCIVLVEPICWLLLHCCWQQLLRLLCWHAWLLLRQSIGLLLVMLPARLALRRCTAACS
jgi:hypothetical protein